MGRRWLANHGRSPKRGQRLLDCRLRESADASARCQGGAGLDWEAGDMRSKGRCLGRVLRANTSSGEGEVGRSSGARSRVWWGAHAAASNRLCKAARAINTRGADWRCSRTAVQSERDESLFEKSAASTRRSAQEVSGLHGHVAASPCSVLEAQSARPREAF